MVHLCLTLCLGVKVVREHFLEPRLLTLSRLDQAGIVVSMVRIRSQYIDVGLTDLILISQMTFNRLDRDYIL